MSSQPSTHCVNCGAASTQRICARCLQNRLCRGCRRYLPKHCFFESSVLCEVRLSLFIEIRFCIDTEVRCLRAHPPLFDPLSRRGLNPIKPVYDPDRSDGRLNLTASAFNYLGQYTNSPGRRGYCYAELAVFFPNGGRNHRQYSLRLLVKGWAGWVDPGGWLRSEIVYLPEGSHTSQN